MRCFACFFVIVEEEMLERKGKGNVGGLCEIYKRAHNREVGAGLA